MGLYPRLGLGLELGEPTDNPNLFRVNKMDCITLPLRSLDCFLIGRTAMGTLCSLKRTVPYMSKVQEEKDGFRVLRF